MKDRWLDKKILDSCFSSEDERLSCYSNYIFEKYRLESDKHTKNLEKQIKCLLNKIKAEDKEFYNKLNNELTNSWNKLCKKADEYDKKLKTKNK